MVGTAADEIHPRRRSVSRNPSTSQKKRSCRSMSSTFSTTCERFSGRERSSTSGIAVDVAPDRQRLALREPARSHAARNVRERPRRIDDIDAIALARAYSASTMRRFSAEKLIAASRREGSRGPSGRDAPRLCPEGTWRRFRSPLLQGPGVAVKLRRLLEVEDRQFDASEGSPARCSSWLLPDRPCRDRRAGGFAPLAPSLGSPLRKRNRRSR